MNLDLKKISGVCTDGASVMIGKRDGLGAKLKQKNRHLLTQLTVYVTDWHWPVQTLIQIFKCVGNVETYML